MEEWTSWQLEGEDIDLEAQKRELERLEQASRDRLVAEELHRDLALVGQLSPTAGGEERDGPDHSSAPEADADEQMGLTLSSSETSRTFSAPGPSRECWAEETPGASHQTQQQPQWFRVSDITPGPALNPPSPHQTFSLASQTVILSDQRLAEQLQVQERQRLAQLSESQSERDAQLARALQEEEEKHGETETHPLGLTRQAAGGGQSGVDAQLAQALQREEGGSRGGGGGERDALLAQRLQEEEREFLQRTEHDAQLAQALQNEQAPTREDTSHDEDIAKQIAAQFEATPLNPTAAGLGSRQPHLLAQPPNWWTVCPNCPPNSSQRFHLIEIAQGEGEWLEVTRPLEGAGFVPQRMQRVQNMKLYQRLQFEKQTMKMDRETEGEACDVNETLLYHTSAASVPVICGEGLDQRLSRKGRFGNGVYFRYIY